MEITGYMCRVSWDGETLTLTATNKMSAVALLGHELMDQARAADDLSVRLTGWDSLEVKRAGALTNGALTVEAGGRKYVAHFRRKDNAAFAELAKQLGVLV